jgi:hypothetical protein
MLVYLLGLLVGVGQLDGHRGEDGGTASVLARAGAASGWSG